jgi:DNA-directed RNA polymerase subunit omega
LINSQGIAEDSKPMSRYSMVVVAAKRAKQIKEGAPILIDTESTNPLTIAMEEIAQGKVTVNASAVTPAPVSKTRAESDSPTRDPRLTEAQAGPLLYNGLSAPVDLDEADDLAGPASLDLDDPQTEALAALAGTDTSDEDVA